MLSRFFLSFFSLRLEPPELTVSPRWPLFPPPAAPLPDGGFIQSSNPDSEQSGADLSLTPHPLSSSPSDRQESNAQDPAARGAVGEGGGKFTLTGWAFNVPGSEGGGGGEEEAGSGSSRGPQKGFLFKFPHAHSEHSQVCK